MPAGRRSGKSTRLKRRHPLCTTVAMLTAVLLLAPPLVAPTLSAEDPPAMTPAPATEGHGPAMTPAPVPGDDAPAMSLPPEEAPIAPTPAPEGADEDGASDTAHEPPPGPKPPIDPGAPPPGTQLDETVIRLLLDTAGLGDFRVLDRKRVAAEWPEAAFMWANDRSVERRQDLVYGMMIERPVAGQGDFDRDVRRIVVKWSADCGGKSSVRMGTRETLPNGKVIRQTAYKCSDTDGALLARGFFVGGENALVGFVHFFTEPGRARGEAADVALYRTFLAIMSD